MPRQLFGNVDPNAQLQPGSSSGVTTTRDETGIYTAFFQQPFANPPAVAVTQIYPNKPNDKGGSALDNAVLIGVTNQLFKVKVGDDKGNARDRWWSFIVVGD